MSWLDGIAGELSDPSWAAGVLANGLSAGIAIAGARWVLQRQLRADREMRRAERRAEVARGVGYLILDVLDEPDIDPEILGDALLSDGFHDDGLAHRLIEPMKDIDRVFGLSHDLDWLWGHRISMWRGATRVASDAAAASDDGHPSTFQLGFAWARMSWPNTHLLHDLGRLWVQWDGLGDLPKIERSRLGGMGGLPDAWDERDQWEIEVIGPRFRKALELAQAGLPPWPWSGDAPFSL